MILGAVVNAGVPLDSIDAALASLDAGGYVLSAEPGQRGGLNGTHVKVEMDDHGRRKRQWSDFINIIQASDLSETVKERSSAIFRRLAEAEAMVHGTTVDEVHLHELGEVDTLVDIVGGVVGLEMLAIERLYCSPFPTGSGVINSEHGRLPAPSPATAALFAMSRAPIVPPPGNGPDAGEMVTPTGAAILTSLATFRQPVMNLENIGYGLGTRDSPYYPNAIALWIGDESSAKYSNEFVILETNIDDMTGELMGYVQEKLFEIGARDVWFTPIQMKKNRPGNMLSAILPASLETVGTNTILSETSTLGVRVRPMARYEAGREIRQLQSSLGQVNVKLKIVEGRVIAVAPEYEDCRKIALSTKATLQSVFRIVQREAEDEFIDWH